jgi:hypothetical protein
MATQAHLATTPYWTESSLPRFPKLERNAHVDVVVVGGGITNSRRTGYTRIVGALPVAA